MSLEMHFEAVIMRTWTPGFSELRDTVEGYDQASLEMHLEAVIERVWRSPGRP